MPYIYLQKRKKKPIVLYTVHSLLKQRRAHAFLCAGHINQHCKRGVGGLGLEPKGRENTRLGQLTPLYFRVAIPGQKSSNNSTFLRIAILDKFFNTVKNMLKIIFWNSHLFYFTGLNDVIKHIWLI